MFYLLLFLFFYYCTCEDSAFFDIRFSFRLFLYSSFIKLFAFMRPLNIYAHLLQFSFMLNDFCFSKCVRVLIKKVHLCIERKNSTKQ